MPLFIYKFIIYLLLPLAILKLIYRGLKNPDYLLHWGERFAIFPKNKEQEWGKKTTVWFHCVSVGETKAINTLISNLIKKYPKINFLISHGTPTGRNVDLPKSSKIHRCYLPYDTGYAAKRFIEFYKPRLGLLIEKELWPNLINQCNTHDVPITLISGRMSNKSLKKYFLCKSVYAKLLGQLDGIHVQYRNDKKNFRKLTKAPINIMGNLKLDVRPPRNIINRIKILKSQLKIKNQFVILASSTRKGEEEEIINLISNLNLKKCVLIIVPRHPERFNIVAKIFEKRKISYLRRSAHKSFTKTPEYILGDSMGELYEYYGLANLAIIGGSILDYGCQNPIESLSMQVPTAVGPSIYNFKDIIEAAEIEGTLTRFNKIKDLEKIIDKLLKYKIKKNSTSEKNSKKLLNQTKKTTQAVENIISQYF